MFLAHDIAHAFNDQPVVCFDLSRTMVDHCDHVYSMIEKFKDGCIFSGKYKISLLVRLFHVFGSIEVD
jgi:hypothetical protein